MKKYLLIALSIVSFATAYAQDGRGKVTKRVVEKNKRADSKTHYNYLLLDVVNETDAFYAEYEKTVQMVWDGKLDVISIKNEKGKAARGIQECLDLAAETPAYRGGDEYRRAVINYVLAVKDKVDMLETLGILGADKDSDSTVYNEASIKFTDLSNEAIDLRNKVRDAKSRYERSFYMQEKK